MIERSITPFQNRVYEAAKHIPRGKVTTYGLLSRFLESSPRAVGQALKRNPFWPAVPCHRVVKGDLTIGGFDGATAGERVDRKRRLLLDEGVRFADGDRIDKDCVYDFRDLDGLPER